MLTQGELALYFLSFILTFRGRMFGRERTPTRRVRAAAATQGFRVSFRLAL